MGVTVVVGGQFGSEGKGKVAAHLARDRAVRAVVRVGGPNSGHTAVRPDGEAAVLRQLPTAALLEGPLCVLGPGSYVDPRLLLHEVEMTNLSPDRLLIDSNAITVTEGDRSAERRGPLGPRIGSTCSGTGAAVRRRIDRRTPEDLVAASRELTPFVGDTAGLLRELLRAGDRVLVEGTQGFGLSILHSPHFPHVTSRDASAAGALAEAGLSPLDVEDIVLVLRAHPIRVAGNSGPFGTEEITWDRLAADGGHERPLREFTSVTGRVRRVAWFDPALVRRAIAVNRPSTIVLNHLDYLDARCVEAPLSAEAQRFVDWVTKEIRQPVDLVGLGPGSLLSSRDACLA